MNTNTGKGVAMRRRPKSDKSPPAPQYPTSREEAKDMTLAEYEVMKLWVCGWAFGSNEDVMEC